MFATDNKNWMPGVGGASLMGFDSNGKPSSTTDPANSADFIAWQRKIDPVTGQTRTRANADQNITYSGLAKYLGAKRIEHTSPEGANEVSRTLESVYRCPSDNLEQRLNDNYYRYSYSSNELIMLPVKQYLSAPTIPAGTPAGARNGFIFTGKYGSIKRSSEIVIYICEDEQTLDDGQYRANPVQWTTAKINGVAGRHRLRRAEARQGSASGKNENCLGNVAFVDGHAGLMTRKDALLQAHTGAFNADPPELDQ
jgi:prepilin-type processing-associated H-X9-DG protein